MPAAQQEWITAKYSLLDLMVVIAAKFIVREALCINFHHQYEVHWP